MSVVHPQWRKSSFSGTGGTGGGDCVEVASMADDAIALRDSKNPGAGVLLVPRMAIVAWMRNR